ncbi:MAG: tetratricopeptide repeat protein [Cyanosarcina radialis HA8281-LM2]|jgi:tetratricopeptide (TPR) repeat protein|nr:tetratricopeptide repeat protein [Cyanosarcina radialis HA8281-LM2]
MFRAKSQLHEQYSLWSAGRLKSRLYKQNPPALVLEQKWRIVLFLFLSTLGLSGFFTNSIQAQELEKPSSRESLEQQESDLDVRLRTARELRSQGDFDGAIAIYQQILASEPRQRDAREGLAFTYSLNNQLDESIRLYEELAKEEPDNLELKLQLAKIYSWKGDLNAAIATYEDILDRDPGNLNARLGLGEVLSWNEQFDEAIAVYQKILESDPGNLDVQIKIAQFTSWANRLNEALDLYNAIIDKHPDAVKALAGRAEVTFWLGKSQKAIALYKSALKSFPESPELLVGLARVYRSQGVTKEALQLIQPLIQTGDREAKKLLAQIQTDLKPSSQLSFSSLSDSDNLTNRTWRGEFNAFIAPQSQMQLQVSQSQIGQPNFDDTSATIYSLGLNQTLSSQWQVSGSIALTDYSDKVLWGVRARWQPTDRLGFQAQISRQAVSATVNSVENEVTQTAYSFGSNFNLDSKTQLNLSIEQAIFDPFNRRDGIFISANRVITTNPFRLDIGYLFRNFGYEKQLDRGYFSPTQFVQHGATLSLELPLNKQVTLFSRNLFGVQTVNDGDSEFSLNITAGLNWQISDRASFRLQYDRFNISASGGGSGYQADEIGGRLFFRF